MTILSIIEEIAATSSRNEKQAILEHNSDCSLLKEVLYKAYNPFINFWIRKIPAYIYNANTGIYPLDKALDDLDVISSRNMTGNAAIEFLAKLLGKLQKEDANILERIVLKDMKAGFSDSTINKVWKNLIPTYPVMLCEQFDQKYIDKFAWPCYVQLKADGMRFNAIVEEGIVSYFSRNGKPLDLKGYLDNDFKTMAAGDNCVFDGELLVLDGSGLPLERKTGNGILAKSIKGTISDAEAKSVIAVLWDNIPLDEFRRGKSVIPYSTRFKILEVKLRVNSTDIGKVSLIESELIDNFEQAEQMYKDYLEQGSEGAVLKNPVGIWEDKRSQNCIKMKGELECDLICVGVTPHDKRKDWIGALVLESKDGKIKVNCGSALDNTNRPEFFKNPPINKIVTVKYNARITDKKTGKESLFLPVFVEIRVDKTEADMVGKIK